MKKILVAALTGFVIGVLFIILVQPTGPRVPRPVESKEANSFHSVTARLNKGGGLYLYLSTEELLEELDKRIESLKKLVLSGESLPEKRKIEIYEAFEVFTRLMDHSGLAEISGIGVSTITLENGLNHSKLVLHHYSGDKDGLIWNLFKEKAGPLKELNMLPADTVFASFNDNRPYVLWQWLKKQIDATGIEPMQKVMVVWDAALKMQGIDLDQLLPQLEGVIGAVVTMDPEKTIRLKNGDSFIKIPQFSAAVMLTVKEGKLMELLIRMFPNARRLEGKAFNGYYIIPPAPGDEPSGPFRFNPVLIQKEDFLIFATDTKIVDAMWAAKQGQKRLKDTEEYKKLARDMPVTGNGFRFLSSRSIETLLEVYRELLMAYGETGEARWQAFEIINPFPENMRLYSVLQNTAEGIVVTANHNMSLEGMLMLPASIFTGVGFAVFSQQAGTGSSVSRAASGEQR
jgi:hypothetical protein